MPDSLPDSLPDQGGCPHVLTGSGSLPDGLQRCVNCGTSIEVKAGQWIVAQESPMSQELREWKQAAGAEAEAGDEARREATRLRAENEALRETLGELGGLVGGKIEYGVGSPEDTTVAVYWQRKDWQRLARLIAPYEPDPAGASDENGETT